MSTLQPSWLEGLRGGGGGSSSTDGSWSTEETQTCCAFRSCSRVFVSPSESQGSSGGSEPKVDSTSPKRTEEET